MQNKELVVKMSILNADDNLEYENLLCSTKVTVNQALS